MALAASHGLKLSDVKLPPKHVNEINEENGDQDNILMVLAEELASTCYLTFARQPTFLAPEITHFNSEPSSTNDFYVKPADSHYLLRPETIESLWYLYYVTGNKTYQDWGWNIFQVKSKVITFWNLPPFTNIYASTLHFRITVYTRLFILGFFQIFLIK